MGEGRTEIEFRRDRLLAALVLVSTLGLIIALPFKIMLFVMVDGWNLLIGSLVRSFG